MMDFLILSTLGLRDVRELMSFNIVDSLDSKYLVLVSLTSYRVDVDQYELDGSIKFFYCYNIFDEHY